MTIVVTGHAGFIGYHTTKRFIEEGTVVIGIDNINDYYDTNLKEARLKELIQIADNCNTNFISRRQSSECNDFNAGAEKSVKPELTNFSTNELIYNNIFGMEV